MQNFLYSIADRRSEELVEYGHKGDADDQQRTELDGQFLFHLLDVAFQFGFGDLKFVFEGEFKGFFSNQTFIKVGLLFGEDFGLEFGHDGPGQAFDESVSVNSVLQSP